MSADTAQARLYHVIEERFVRSDDGIPSQEVLDESESALAAIWEFLAQGIAEAVITVANAGEPNSITHEDIGRLIIWSDWMKERAEEIIAAAAKVAIIAHDSHSVAVGCHGDGSGFNEHGSPRDHAQFKRRAAEYGFNV